MKSVIGLVFGLLLIVAVSIIALEIYGSTRVTNRPAEQSSTDTKTPGQTAVTITYTDQGFAPAEVTITKGSTVQFVNESSIPLWVASDPHPEHTNYPAFDTVNALGGEMPKPDDDFSFTFDKSGTWSFHSHNASSDTGSEEVHPGKIIVE